LSCDVRDEPSVTAMAKRVRNEVGSVHTVVANAGIAGPTKPMHQVTLDEWRECIEIDLEGVFLTFRAFVPQLVDAGAGSLIAISSMTGKRPLYGRSPYAAAKMGVIGLVRTLALELGPAACAYLASDRAGAVTGEDLNVSAGVVMY
jgi:NAD(P)-dependent dehydrogenase (short-subunit alcohol dehydrogenase family)